MFKKWLKPNFLISAKSHRKIAQNCVRIQELDSRIMELRQVRRNDECNDTKEVDRPFTSCFASH